MSGKAVIRHAPDPINLGKYIRLGSTVVEPESFSCAYCGGRSPGYSCQNCGAPRKGPIGEGSPTSDIERMKGLYQRVLFKEKRKSDG